MDAQTRSGDLIKATQALRYLLSFDDNGKMNRLKLIKLFWAADRYHIRHYGRLILESEYVAMRFGPVASLALDVARVKSNEYALDKEDVEYVGHYLTADNEDTTATLADVESDYLSDTDKEALKWAWDTFGNMGAFDIANNISHNYPEWSKFEDFFNFGRGQQRINPLDFFENPEGEDQFFQQDEEELSAARDIYLSQLGAKDCLREVFGVL